MNPAEIDPLFVRYFVALDSSPFLNPAETVTYDTEITSQFPHMIVQRMQQLGLPQVVQLFDTPFVSARERLQRAVIKYV